MFRRSEMIVSSAIAMSAVPYVKCENSSSCDLSGSSSNANGGWVKVREKLPPQVVEQVCQAKPPKEGLRWHTGR
jgi:hypothetical protein